jgi:hypothetical protein
MEETTQLIQEIVEAKRSIIRIDANDIKDTFRGGGSIHGFTVSVSPALEGRVEVLMDEVKKKAEWYKPFNNALVFFFFPEDYSLLIDELQPFSDWIESIPDEFMIKWGMAIQSTQEIRTIVLLQ